MLDRLRHRLGLLRSTRLRRLFYGTQAVVVLYDKGTSCRRQCSVHTETRKHGRACTVRVSRDRLTSTHTFDVPSSFEAFKRAVYGSVYHQTLSLQPAPSSPPIVRGVLVGPVCARVLPHLHDDCDATRLSEDR